MKIEEVYLQFIQQVNQNLTNNNISVDKPRFILLYNDVLNRYIEWILEKRNEDVIRYVSPLLVLNKKLVKVSSKETFDGFTLPENYFDLSSLYVTSKTSNCGEVRLKTWEIKGEDLEEKYHDKFNEPSIEYRETFYLTASGNVEIFKKGFDIQEALLSYYRYPKKADIEGYIHADGTQSQNIHPELDDKATGRVIIAMAKEFSANNKDVNSYKIDSDRLFNPI